MKKKSFDFYIQGAVQLGIAFGVVSLLARWITGNTILSSPETLIQYGLIGGIGYAFMGGLALILFGFVARKISYTFLGKMTIGDVLKQKLNPFGYWYMMALLISMSIYTLFIQVMGAGLLLHILFPVPLFIGMSIFLFFLFLIGGIGGLYRIHQLAGISVILVFGTIILIPVYSYMQEGVTVIFEGIRLYHPYLLFTTNKESLWFISTGLLIFFGQMITDRATWQRVFVIKKEKVKMVFILTGLIWFTVPIAITSLFLLAISGRSFDNIYSLIFELINILESNMLIFVFILFCFAAILSAASSELHALNSLFVRNIVGEFKSLTNHQKFKYKNIFSLVLISMLLITAIVLTPYPLELLFFFGHVYSSMIFAMLYIVFSKGKDTLPPVLSSFIGAVGGLVATSFTSYFESIWVSFFLSAIIISLFVLKNLLQHHSRSRRNLEDSSHDAH
ncbi:hypothetical protein [Planomicrobium sp. YIM 101495]|uniref:hypothetical protein n=1 Tax=Planomicrobium sp. YIM 101495 TaxID=2665160 RepID=UPI0013F8CDE7|nr:hypothetical protein [Planomicrobium sp. YIM 101495]MTD30655.1 hypothetical protein [Planomicrobium sp. YIM 101495]